MQLALMGFPVRSNRDVWLYTFCISLVATLATGAALLLLYIYQGPGGFNMQNAIIFASFLPSLISTPISLAILRMALKLSSTQAELKRLANTDPLTQLDNRRSFFFAAEHCLAEAASADSHAALLVFDADHFKDLNDNYGHAAGDQALVSIAAVLRANFRSEDLICRVGGEEFAVLIPGVDAQTAEPLAQRLVDSIANAPLTLNGAIIEYSVSCGIADTSQTYDLAALFKTADDAMYLAKQQGRCRVALHKLAA